MNATYGRTSGKQFAHYDPDTSSWKMWPATGLWGSIEYSETWPKTGSMSGGRAYEHPTSAPHTIGNGYSSSPHLPTPAACNPNDGEGPETWLKRQAETKARVGNGNGMGMPLTIAVQLLDAPRLPTPTASGADKERNNPAQARRKSPPLSAISAHLPTPRTTDANGAGHHGTGGADLRTTITETAGWGKYEPTIQRWEQHVGPAPAPTETNRNGKPRLAAAFAEWLMGLPAGWVTNPDIGITRAQQLKAIGNGVVPQQAVAALHQLLQMETP